MVIGLGMGAAMSAMDILSQGAVLRGGSDLDIGKRRNDLLYIIINTVLLRFLGTTA